MIYKHTHLNREPQIFGSKLLPMCSPLLAPASDSCSCLTGSSPGSVSASASICLPCCAPELHRARPPASLTPSKSRANPEQPRSEPRCPPPTALTPSKPRANPERPRRELAAADRRRSAEASAERRVGRTCAQMLGGVFVRRLHAGEQRWIGTGYQTDARSRNRIRRS